jgi:hypothetical protein
MARTALTATSLTRDTGSHLGVGATPDATNGNIVASPGPFKLGILVLNADGSDHTLIIRASGYAGAATGSANATYTTDQYQPWAQASVGDLSVTCAHATGGYSLIEALTSDRYVQSDGSVWLDWSASTSMTVWVWTKPYMP